jgi:Glycosyl transferase family 2
MNVRIVIPVFDEAATVSDVVRAARRYAPVLVVDDGSSDASAELAAAAGAEVIRHPRRLGKAHALRTGAGAAGQQGATHIVTLDGDGQHAADDLPMLLAAARQAPEALVLGTRVRAGDDGGVPAGRLNAIRVAGFFVNWVSGLRLGDTQSGCWIYPLAVLARLGARRGGFVFETEVLVAAAAASVRVVEVPITVIPRASRRSRFRPIADGAAISAYLTGQTLVRWAIEGRAACGEVAALVRRDRRRVRHAAVLASAAARGDSLPGWGLALAVAGIERVADRLALWWRDPRRERAGAAAAGCLAAPILLALAAVHAMAGRLLPDLVTPFVGLVYAQEKLSHVGIAGPLRARREEPSATVDPRTISPLGSAPERASTRTTTTISPLGSAPEGASPRTTTITPGLR